MKQLRYFPILLSFLLLTGCGAGSKPASDAEDDIIVITESVPETTQTEPETTEGTTEEVTETEAPTTEPIPQFDDPAEQLRYVVEKVLVPEYGLSDTGYFDPEKGDAVIEPPKSTQGIISAFSHDFFGDDTPELLLIRSDGFHLICGLYDLTNGCELIDQKIFSSNENNVVALPSFHIAGDQLILRETTRSLGSDKRTTSIRLVNATDQGFIQNGCAEMQFQDGEFTLQCTPSDSTDTDKSTYSATSLDYNEISYAVRDVLESAGLQVETVRTAYPGGGVFQMEAELAGEELLFMVDSVPDSGTFFLDNTGLRDLLDGKNTKPTKPDDEDAEDENEDADSAEDDADSETETEETTES